MADGDAAAAIGLAIINGTAKVREFFKHVNATRDMIANHITGGTHSAAQITSGTFDAARIPSLDETKVTAAGKIKSGSAELVYNPSGSQWQTSQGLTSLANVFASGSLYSAGATPVAGSYTAVYRDNATGRIGLTPSARRFKKSVRKWKPDVRALLALEVVEFQYKKTAVDGADDRYVIGLIAEDLVTLGLDEFVAFTPEGEPLTVHYERIVLAVIPVVQDHEARLVALEKGAAK